MQGICVQAAPADHAGRTRTYYVAADEVEWNYAPSGRDEAMGMPFDAIARGFAESGPHQIGRVNKKAVYHEYLDATFTKPKPRDPEDQYLGLMGPILRAEVGDTIKVVFKNNATHPFSMHPHGVVYAKDSEGADYNDGSSGADKEDGCVAPGATHVYTWDVPDRAGPGPADPSSVFWLYHSHCDELRDVASGLFGGIIVTRRGMALPDGRPKDVTREFVTMFIAINENESWYLEDNIREHTTDPKGVKRDEIGLTTADGMAGTVASSGFVFTNVKWSINGYIYGNMPMMTMKKGDHVRWYVTTLGDFNNAHTPHWHGNTVLIAGQRTDVISVVSAQMVTADMIPDATGIWLYHCHISDHMLAGMVARYQVTDR
ncbi:MAG TPA: multicopper oxidase domain-containing protein [Terracidiphilus sp.]|jgi:FtsP/CotA-like multicopper oxidase with cupredoxin domain|nr:multicopper oxidase domain-containing protein [Terracidiphilus sp.]